MCRTAARLILQSSSRAIPTRLLQQKLGSDSSLSITVLVQKGVLLLREVSYFVSDLPKDVYGQLREQVACLPSKVYEKVWEEILAAEVIPAASKPLAPFETQTASATCSAMKMHLHGWIGVEDIWACRNLWQTWVSSSRKGDECFNKIAKHRQVRLWNTSCDC